MSWRKILKEDCVRGTLVRIAGISDGYNNATIISIDNTHIKLARPYAYANEHYNSNNAMMGCEVFEVSISRAVSEDTDLEVYQGKDCIRKMLT